MKAAFTAIVVALVLIVPASSSPGEPTLTGYILIAHQCADVGEIVLLVFSDGSFFAQLVALVPPESWELLAEARQNVESTVYLIKGPFDTCPRAS